jgi:adenosylmethionine-8-amino-7-oxononanoate aminotransferase
VKAVADIAQFVRSFVLHRSPRHAYSVATKGSGLHITDASGHEYLDMSGGAAVSCLGHAHPDVVAAVQKQVATLAFAHTSFFTNEPQEQLASRLVNRIGDPDARAYFLAGGSEANETALKLAWQYWAALGRSEKKLIISREHSYHGNTFGALSASGNGMRRLASAAPLIDWPRIPACYEYRERNAGESLEAFAERSAGYLEDAIVAAGSERVAAFIAEPIVGSSLGVVPAVPGYFERVRDICDRHEVLFISDEVMCGSGRTGHYFAHEHENIRPDIVTLAKGIAGGYQPLAAAIVSGSIASELESAGFAHGHTYIGHPVACAAGNAVQDVIDRDDLLARTRKLGDVFVELLQDRFGDHPRVGDIRSRGLFAGLELVSNRETRDGFENGRGLAEQLRRAAMDQGLICYPASIMINELTVPHILLAPPMIAEQHHLEDGLARLARAIDATVA